MPKNVTMRLISMVVGLSLLASACGSSPGAIPDDAFPIIGNADLAIGSQRLLVGLVAPDSQSFAAPDLAIEVDLYPPESDEPAIAIPGTFIWTVPDVRGIYSAEVNFAEPGTWRVAVHEGDLHLGTSTPFQVAEQSLTPSIGAEAPSIATPTTADADLAQITTDSSPDPRFYEISLDQALESGRPTVVVFSTPAWCETSTCGPMLDTVKAVSPSYENANFIHIEIYENLDAASREELVLMPAVDLWKLPSEPWVFVVDSLGEIVAKFEGAMSTDELTDVLSSLR